MKKYVALLLLAVMFAGCATAYPVGMIYTELKLPVQGVDPGSVEYSKVGVAMATSVLGLVATGDASIQAAVRDGGIKKIKYIDWDAKNILGIYGEYKTTVYGD